MENFKIQKSKITVGLEGQMESGSHYRFENTIEIKKKVSSTGADILAFVKKLEVRYASILKNVAVTYCSIYDPKIFKQ